MTHAIYPINRPFTKKQFFFELYWNTFSDDPYVEIQEIFTTHQFDVTISDMVVQYTAPCQVNDTCIFDIEIQRSTPYNYSNDFATNVNPNPAEGHGNQELKLGFGMVTPPATTNWATNNPPGIQNYKFEIPPFTLKKGDHCLLKCIRYAYNGVSAYNNLTYCYFLITYAVIH